MNHAGPPSQTPKQKQALHRLIWHYLRSTVLFWLPAVIFLGLADNVRDKEPLPGDVTVLNVLYSFSNPFLDQTFLFITALGGTATVMSGVIVASSTLWYLGKRRLSLFLAFSAGGTALINTLFKVFFSRERPALWEQLIVEPGFSFPSGHAMIAAALSMAIILMAWQTKYRWYAIIFGVLYTLLVSISRIYLGVHYPSDVLAGWCVSILWIITLHRFFSRFIHQSQRSDK